jgi:hypothetical protein
MGTIYFKETGSLVGTGMGLNSFVLEPREALFYPFDLGTGWITVRVGMYYNWIGVSGNNSPFSTESIAAWKHSSTNFKPNNNFYFGLTSDDALFPFQDGNTYIGICAPTSSSNFSLNNSHLSLSFHIFSGKNYKQIQSPLNTYISEFGPTGYTGNHKVQTAFLGFELSIDKARSGYLITGSILGDTNSDALTRHSLSHLRSDTINAGYSTTPSTGYLTNNFQSDGTVWDKIPNSLIVYSPFFFNRMRIFNIGVFKVE